jgi:replicative DNA helicase
MAELSRLGDQRERAARATPPGRVPPNSLEAERAVLGGVLLDNDAMNVVLETVDREDFYSDAHALLFEAMTELFRSGKPIDTVTLREEVVKQGKLAAIGGDEYLLELTNTIPTVANIESHARIVREKAIVRRLILASHEIAARGYGDYGETEEFLDAAEKAVFEVAQNRLRSPYEHIKDVVLRTFTQIHEAAERGEKITGLPSGFGDLDDMTAGMHPGDLIIIAGRPGMGKTAFAINVAVNACMHRKAPVAIFSLEMPKEQLVRRMLCSEARVDGTRMRSGQLWRDDWPKLARAAGTLSELPVWIDDTPALTVTELRAKTRRLKSQDGLDLVVVDYMQLMRSGSKNDSREQEISEISRNLKGLAKELSIPVIALSQLNRGVETRGLKDKRPQLADLRECVTGDTLVLLADGSRVPIERLVDQAPEVLAMVHGRIAPARSDLVWPVGERNVFDVRLANGRSIRATERHRLFSDHGWFMIGDLRAGDGIAYSEGAGRSICYEPIVDIVPAGRSQVFDLTVPGPASWLADGIVSHNSGAIEQDADTIMFIYRDEVYNRDAVDSRNRAEIIIGKQRAGPTGTVHCAFFNEYTRFDNLARDEYPDDYGS